MKVCCDTEGRELTDERRYAPTSVPLRRKPCSRSPETLFHFTGIPTNSGAKCPTCRATCCSPDGELRVLATFARSRKLPPPARLGDAVGLVGRLGGWLGRQRDPPGAQLMWHGYTQLVAMAFAFELRDEFG